VEILYNEYNAQAAFAVASLLGCLAVVTLVLKAIVEARVRHVQAVATGRPVEVIPWESKSAV